MATLVQQTANSIGYVELAYALQHQLSFGASLYVASLAPAINMLFRTEE